jgi:uncharacterized protein with HEPN domain
MDELDRERLLDMLDYARAAIRARGTRDETTLAHDETSLLAVSHAVQIVGEAAAHVSQPARDALPGIPWTDVVGMRHHLVHGYRRGDIPLIALTVARDLPALISLLERALEDDTA